MTLAALMCAPSAKAQSADVPDWVLNVPQRAGWVHAASSGQSRIDALADAIRQLAEFNDPLATLAAPAPSAESSSVVNTRAVTNRTVGSIQVQMLVERTYVDSTGADVPNKVTRLVRLTSADRASKIEYFFSETEGAEPSVERTVSLEGDLQIFLTALAGIGARITTHDGRTHYSVLIAVPERSLKP